MSEPNIAQKSPYVLEAEPKKYAWCACGLSSGQPFCDGSHKSTDIRPVVVEVKTREKIAWCGCKHSQTKPFCDGTHREL
jgi:CDGSH-type Zn-finger protein